MQRPAFPLSGQPAVATTPELVRVLGRWSLTALVVNAVIGSGVFGLPDDLVRFVGVAAPWAYVLAAAGIAISEPYSLSAKWDYKSFKVPKASIDTGGSW